MHIYTYKINDCHGTAVRSILIMAEKSSVEPSAKKPKRASRWQSEWTKYRLSASKKGSSYAYCNVCSVDFSITGGVVHEVKHHLDSKNTKIMQSF